MVTDIPAGERFSPAQLYKSASENQCLFRAEVPVAAFQRLNQLIRDYRLVAANQSVTSLKTGAVAAGAGDEHVGGVFSAKFTLGKFAESSFFSNESGHESGSSSGVLANSANGVQGSKDERAAATPMITASGELQATLELQCQRCLGTYQHDVATQFKFAFAANELTADLLPDSYDPVLLGEDGYLTVVEMFEDELLLRLPTHAMHEDSADCDNTGVPYEEHVIDPSEAKPENPFAALKGLSFPDN